MVEHAVVGELSQLRKPPVTDQIALFIPPSWILPSVEYTVVSFPDPKRSPAKKGSGDNTTVYLTCEARGHVTYSVNCW